MDAFINCSNGDTRSPGNIDSIYSKPKTFTRKIRLDSKGRISLPVEIRRNYGLDKDSEISIAFSLEANLIFILIGRDGVAGSTGACGAPGPGSNPGPGPENDGRRR